MDDHQHGASAILPGWVERKRFNVGEFHRMVHAGIIAEDDSFELIDGEVLRMSPIGGRHIRVVMNLTRLFVTAAGREFDVHVQSPIRLGAISEPEPDLSVMRPEPAEHPQDLPPAGADAVLLVEVADTTLRYDTEIKLPLYARHGIPEVWVIDVIGRTIEVHRSPAEGTYTVTFPVRGTSCVSPEALPNLIVSPASLGL